MNDAFRTIGINSLKKFIAIANVASVQDIGNQLDWVKEYGGECS